MRDHGLKENVTVKKLMPNIPTEASILEISKTIKNTVEVNTPGLTKQGKPFTMANSQITRGMTGIRRSLITVHAPGLMGHNSSEDGKMEIAWMVSSV